jgi:hypothetical protein
MSLSDPIVIALITAFPALVGACIGLVNHSQGAKIHVLVNSNMTAVKTDLALATERIQKLQALVESLTAASKTAPPVVNNLLLPIPVTIPTPI